jgi:hypothetical protein
MNDPLSRTLHFGLPSTKTTPYPTAPTLVHAMNYRELDTAYQVDQAAPIHTSYTGKLIATDHTRKWARWNMTINGAALMCRAAGGILQPVFFGGNGQQAQLAAGFANVYTLSAIKYTDDDYGQIYPYYTTYFFVTHDLEEALQLGSGQKMLQYFTAFVAGLGTLTITPLINALTNAWALTGTRTLSAAPVNDLEWAGGCATGYRIAFKLASSPITGTDNWFNLQKIVAGMKLATHRPIRGSV